MSEEKQSKQIDEFIEKRVNVLLLIRLRVIASKL